MTQQIPLSYPLIANYTWSQANLALIVGLTLLERVTSDSSKTDKLMALEINTKRKLIKITMYNL